MNPIADMAAGKAGEYLVCADLIMRGHVAFPSEQGLPYDVVAEIGDRLLRIQVKTTREARPPSQRVSLTPSYIFNVRRCGKGGAKQNIYADLFALVALDTRTIGYLNQSQVARTMVFRSPAFRGLYKNEVDLNRAKLIKAAYAAGEVGSKIAADLKMDHSVVSRVGRRPLAKGIGAPYLDDLSLAAALA